MGAVKSLTRVALRRILKLLQPFQTTGKLIKVFVKTIDSPDIMGFGAVLFILLYGFSAAFAVAMPTNDEFFTVNATILPGFMTTWFAMTGNWDREDFEDDVLACVPRRVGSF